MDKIILLQEKIGEWGRGNIRSYPWRYHQEPYPVLISEFMLHRTQTRQVLPVYEKFILRFPTLADYASAGRWEAESILISLGLNWRIAGMLNALDEIWRDYGEVPTDYDKLIAVGGIGQYIAGATICFTLNRPITIVDSNIVRVIGRVYDLDLRGEARRKKSVITAIRKSVDPVNPRDFYYSIIDLAHLFCRPINPVCWECPLRNIPCGYADKNTQGDKLISISDK